MVLDMSKYISLVKSLNINIIYSGPLWEDGIKGIAEIVKAHLDHNQIPGSSAKSIFSVFVEQVTNMLMYSADKKSYTRQDSESVEVSEGMMVMGHRENMFFIQTRNAIKNENVKRIKDRLDHLNTLDKQQLRQLHKEVMQGENDNPESKGAGLGLIEIARRATEPIGYTFEPVNDNLSSFTMYVVIEQGVSK